MMHSNNTPAVNGLWLNNSSATAGWAMFGRRPFLSLLFLLFPLLLWACTPTDTSWERVQNAQTMRIGLDPTYPPFANADEGPLVGLDADLGHAIGQALGVRVEFVHLGYDGLYDALANQQVDVLLSALVIDETKAKDFAYTTPYFNAGQFLVVQQAEAMQVARPTDLVGRQVAVELGSEGHLQALRWERQVAGLTVVPFPSVGEAVQAVVAGTADAAVVDAVSGRWAVRDNPTLALLPEPVTVEPYALVVRRTDQALLAQLNRGLAQLEQQGTLAQILGRWLDE